MIPVKLTKSENTIHVDEVDESKGVYAKTGDSIAWWMTAKQSFVRQDDMLKDVISYPSFRRAVECWGNLDLWEIFTLSGQKIVLEKELTVDKLTNKDHIGLVVWGNRGHIVQIGNGPTFICVDLLQSDNINVCNSAYTDNSKSIQDAINYLIKDFNIVEIYKFPTRKDLYQWLAQ